MRNLLLFLGIFVYLQADGHIFIYHRFEDSRYPSTSISIKKLKEQFEYFKQNGYKVVPLETLTDKIEQNETIENLVALTIDDGYKSFYENAYSLFKEYNYPFTMFVYVEAVDKKYNDFMSWEQLKELMPLGTLQFHSYGHLHMGNLSEEKIREDFELGLEKFKANLNTQPKFFSYPYGEYTDKLKEITKSYNLKALTQDAGGVSSFSDPYALARTPLGENSNLKANLNEKALNATWIKPISYPKDGILKDIEVKVDSNATKAHLYITKLGSREVKVKNKIIKLSLNEKLQKNRTRLVIGIKNHLNTKLLVKD